jgi:hypothetical protein
MKPTFTKVAVKALLIVGVINAMIPYALAAFGKEPVTELGIAWITEIVAVILGYMCKAYKETKQEAIQAHEDYLAGIGEMNERDDLSDTENCD